MYWLAVVPALALAGCGADDPCGELTLELTAHAGDYPSKVDVGCELQTGSVWDKLKNDATIVFPGLPADAHVSAHLPLDMVKGGMTFTVPTGIAGEAFTKNDTNHANLTGGTVTIIRDMGTDPKANARVFEVEWQLEWLGAGTYRSSGGGAAVWFIANHGL
ncbi:MAG: hypothetical protein H0T46_17290 [Deltaproteobacteria bacterium]|nr:hypothetical protein [Deltaproteobacteria bacterium]